MDKLKKVGLVSVIFVISFVLVSSISENKFLVKEFNNLTASSTRVSTVSSESIEDINKNIEDIVSKKSFSSKRLNSKVVDLLAKREASLLEQLKNNPLSIKYLNLSRGSLEKLAKAGYTDLEKDVTKLSGNLEILHYDDFDNQKNSRFEYYIATPAGTKYRLYASNESSLSPNTKIEVSGKQIENNIIGEVKTLSRNTNNQNNLEPGPAPYKIGVFLVRPQEIPEPFTNAEAKEHVFGTAGQFAKFVKEGSYNRRYVTGDVFGWIESSIENTCESSFLTNIESNPEVVSYIVNNNISLSSYKHIYFVLGCGNGGGISTVGSWHFSVNANLYDASLSYAYVGDQAFSPSPWSAQFPQPFSWQRFDYITIHEMGHGFGLKHANGLDCGDISLGNNCTNYEYGNSFDAMGFGTGYAFQYNAIYKGVLGWLKPSEVLQITSSGTYTVNPLETIGGIKFAHISNPLLPSYVMAYGVENRRAISFDKALGAYSVLTGNQNGLLINRYGNYAGLETSLIDATPSSQEFLEDTQNAALTGSNVFSDPATGITIGPIISVPSKNAITFNVTIDTNIPPCTNNPPLIIQNLPYYAYTTGFNPIGVKISNIDPLTCGNAHNIFRVELNFPDDIISYQSGISYIAVNPQNISQSYISIKLFPDTPPGEYPFTITARNDDFPDLVTVENAILIVQ